VGARKPLSNNVFTAPVEERAEAYVNSFSYAGTFTFNGDKVVHHIEASSFSNWVNTDLVRTITNLQGDRLTLWTTGPFVWNDGVRYAYQELVWDRLK
jgi:hypothetical protein